MANRAAIDNPGHGQPYWKISSVLGAVIPQPPNPICWAKSLGDCSTEPSGEHIISESTFSGPELGFCGFPFQQGRTGYLPRSRFKSNILCRKHNNELSTVDQAGVDAFAALKMITSPIARRKSKIDGALFERWLLKTLINIEVVSDFTLAQSTSLVERAFGKIPLPNNSGLFFPGKKGTTATIEDRMIYRRKLWKIEGSTQICAATFTICGFEFLFTLGEPQFAAWAVRPMHHPHRINYGKSSIVFSWPRTQ